MTRTYALALFLVWAVAMAIGAYLPEGTPSQIQPYGLEAEGSLDDCSN